MINCGCRLPINAEILMLEENEMITLKDIEKIELENRK
jgi:hypothetical protein